MWNSEINKIEFWNRSTSGSNNVMIWEAVLPKKKNYVNAEIVSKLFSK